MMVAGYFFTKDTKQSSEQDKSSNEIGSSSGSSRNPLTMQGTGGTKKTSGDSSNWSHILVSNGRWSDPTVWSGNQIPRFGARVRIPKGREVILDLKNTGHLEALEIDGTLRFTPDQDTRLISEYIHITPGGYLEVGTLERPIESNSEALITLLPTPGRVTQPGDEYTSAMMVSEGRVSISGTPKSSFVPLEFAPEQGGNTIQLSEIPENWVAGDHIIIAGNRATQEETETFQIVGINGSQLKIRDASIPTDQNWNGVEGDYTPNQDQISFAVNLTRNVAITSMPTEMSEAEWQGALSFQGDGVGGAQLHHVALYGLGMREGEVDGFANPQTRQAISFNNGSDKAHLSGLIMVDAPESNIVLNNADLEIANSAAFNEEGGVWLNANGQSNQLLWKSKRTTSKALRGAFGGNP